MEALVQETLKQLANYGPIGIILVYFVWQDNKTKAKLIEIIENNTKVIQELKDIIDKCQTIHRN